MADYTINSFWKRRLPASQASQFQALRGWIEAPPGLATFKEEPLSKSGDFGADENPTTSPVILVSAPGAVGKSTLARQIAATTGAVYVDLAKSDPVGGNTLSGGSLSPVSTEHGKTA